MSNLNSGLRLKYRSLGLCVRVILKTYDGTQYVTLIRFRLCESRGKKMPKAPCKPNIVQCRIKWDLNISDYIFSRMSVLTEMQQSVTWPFCDIQCIEITRERLGFDMLN